MDQFFDVEFIALLSFLLDKKCVLGAMVKYFREISLSFLIHIFCIHYSLTPIEYGLGTQSDWAVRIIVAYTSQYVVVCGCISV